MKKEILSILKDICFDCDFSTSENFVEDGFMDSFDIIILVEKLESTFLIKIPGNQITLNNFKNLKSLEGLIEKLSTDRFSFQSF